MTAVPPGPARVMRARAALAGLFVLIPVSGFTRGFEGSHLFGHLNPNIWSWSSQRSQTNKITFPKPVSLENVRKSKINPHTYNYARPDYSSWGTFSEDFTEIFQR